MSNVMDYLVWRGDLSFASSGPNEVDIFIASQLSTPDYTDIIDKDFVSISYAADNYFKNHSDSVKNLGVLQSVGVLPMLKVLGTYPRYRDVRLGNYENIINLDTAEQFSAVTLDFPCGVRCICYRGTDDTIVGWKEDFRLALYEKQPAQKDAVSYLQKAAEGFCGDIIVCGHSKGGNLAVYAAVNASADIQSKISAVYSFDGPGFGEGFFESNAYSEIKDRIFTIISQHSMVGVLMKTAGKRVIVKSRVSGPYAHDGFNWEVLGRGFVKLQKQSGVSRSFEEAINTAVSKMPREEIEEFIDEFFGPLEASGAITLSELEKLKPSAKLELLHKLRSSKRVGHLTASVLEQMVKP